MNRLLFVVIAIGLAIGLLAPDGREKAHANGDATASGTFSSTSTAARELKALDSRQAQSMAFNSGNDVVLSRDESGHFFVDAQVNGAPVRFLVDTGASGVALTTVDAQRVGLPFTRGEFTTVGEGASGPVNGKFVTLDRVTMKGKSVQNVAGVIIDGGDTSLLGQSFLSRMGKIEITGDTMVIR